MLEIASQMILCLLFAALIGFIIGYLFGKMTCANDACEPKVTAHTNTDGDTIYTTKQTLVNSVSQVQRLNSSENNTPSTSNTKVSDNQKNTVTSITDTTEVKTTKTERSETQQSTNLKTDSTTTPSINKKSDTNTKKHTKEVVKQKLSSPEILTAPRNGEKDNLTRIKGIGTKIDAMLNDIGIYHFDQIAAWNEENLAWADSTLGFPGRAERENWVAQATTLAEGKETEFSKRVDEGKVSSSKKD